MVAEGITIKYSMINMDKILDAPTAIAPTDIIYGTQISNVLKREILKASLDVILQNHQSLSMMLETLPTKLHEH